MNHSELQKLASERKQYSAIIAWSVNPRPTLCKVILWDLTHVLCWNFQNILYICVSNCDIFEKNFIAYDTAYCNNSHQFYNDLGWFGQCDVQLLFLNMLESYLWFVLSMIWLQMVLEMLKY